MPGTFIVRPIEANLTHNTDLIGKMNPYCSFMVGNTKIKSQICKKGGKHPTWTDSVQIPATNESKILVEVMDKDKITHDDSIGSFILDLNEVQSTGQISRWYPLTYKNKAAGEILLETVFQPDAGMMGTYGEQNYGTAGMTGMTTGMATGMVGSEYGAISGGQNQYYEQERLVNAQPAIIEQEVVTTTTTAIAQPVIQEEIRTADVSAQSHSHVWTEQRQVVEPHTFIKEVEVVETRGALKEIEVMEPVKVLKDVQYTQAVPVTKQIEVVEPQVVRKDVEVMEPRLVTKTIQVVENVPVKRQIEVVEMRNTIQEVETFEPQTFTKQVEVTEYVPVRQQVTVTQPVTVKKAVEYVEPVITTQYITKELQQPVIVNEQVTTTVGPASVIGVSREYGYVEQFGQMNISEQQALSTHQRWVGFETIFGGLNERERLFEQQRLSRLSEQEWLAERQRLMAFNEQQRLMEQRRFFSQFQSGGGFSGYQQTTSQGMSGFGGQQQSGMSGFGGQQQIDLGHKVKDGHNQTYNPSPNF